MGRVSVEFIGNEKSLARNGQPDSDYILEGDLGRRGDARACAGL